LSLEALVAGHAHQCSARWLQCAPDITALQLVRVSGALNLNP
jgi:hypothetical protein